MNIYQWKKLKKSEYKCEFNLRKVFDSWFSPELEYFEDKYECGVCATFQVSDDNQDWWVCGRHLDSLFPTVREEVNKKDEKRLYKQRQHYHRKKNLKIIS